MTYSLRPFLLNMPSPGTTIEERGFDSLRLTSTTLSASRSVQATQCKSLSHLPTLLHFLSTMGRFVSTMAHFLSTMGRFVSTMAHFLSTMGSFRIHNGAFLIHNAPFCIHNAAFRIQDTLTLVHNKV